MSDGKGTGEKGSLFPRPGRRARPLLQSSVHVLEFAPQTGAVVQKKVPMNRRQADMDEPRPSVAKTGPRGGDGGGSFLRKAS